MVPMWRYFAVAAIVSSLIAPGADRAEERERDTYKIYSRLLTNPETSHGGDGNKRYLIAAVTHVEPGNPAECVTPPKDREAQFKEVMADFAARKGNRVLTRRFSISKPYQLLSDADAAKFAKERFDSGEPQSRFKGVIDIFIFADVYFSKNGRLALTAMSTWCGNLCGQHSWRIFEKNTNGDWQELPWVTCFTIARTPEPSRCLEI